MYAFCKLHAALVNAPVQQLETHRITCIAGADEALPLKPLKLPEDLCQPPVQT
jgi:hypothetical protein